MKLNACTCIRVTGSSVFPGIAVVELEPVRALPHKIVQVPTLGVDDLMASLHSLVGSETVLPHLHRHPTRVQLKPQIEL